MRKEIYNYQSNVNYSLNKSNIYAYSFFDTHILHKPEEFIIDLDSIIAHISNSINDDASDLLELREKNHLNYYKLDTKFLNEVDSRYQKISDKIINDYKSIDSSNLLLENINDALKHANQIDLIAKQIEILKEKVQEDLLVIIDYVDKDEKQIDLSFLNDDNSNANLLKKKYNAILLQKSVFRLDNLNLEMERQRNRLSLIRQLIPLSKRYSEKRDEYLKLKYDEDNTKQLKDNLSIILSEYIFLLSHQEFHDLRKVYKGMLDNDYSYVNEFIYTYKFIIDKIWKYCLTNIEDYKFDFCYLVCYSDVVLNNTQIELMNRNNMDLFNDTGYICNYSDNICDVFNIEDERLISLKLPFQIDGRIKLDVIDNNKIDIKAVYNKGYESIINDRYPVIEIR